MGLDSQARGLSTLRPFVLLVPMLAFIVAAAASLIDLDGFFAVASAMNSWILDTFSETISIAVFCFVLTCVAVVLSPLGRVRIGGHEAKPLLSWWNWFSITLCTTIATGILFWAMAEPMFHLYTPGGRALEPGTDAAQSFTLVSLFMHWAISPYAIYTVAGLSFALSYHNLKRPYSVSGPLSVLAGRALPSAVSSGLDTAILLALVLGMAASLGAGMLMLAGGLSSMTGWPNGPLLLALFAILIAATVLISSLTGLLKGIRILSDINTKFFFAFVAFIFITGPTWEIINGGLSALYTYAVEFVPRSLFIGEAAVDKGWAKD